MIGAERYWVGVLQGRMDVDDDDSAYPTLCALSEFRERVALATRAYIHGASAAELNTPRKMVT